VRWLDQVESVARDALPAPVFRYVAEGARDEITLGEAVAAWQSIRVAPRVLRDVRNARTSTDLLGTTFDHGIAPATLQRAADRTVRWRWPGPHTVQGCPRGLQQLRQHVRGHPGHRRHVVAADLRCRRPRRHPATARGGGCRRCSCDRPDRGRAGCWAPATRRRTSSGCGRWPTRRGSARMPPPGGCGTGRPHQGQGPGPRRHPVAGDLHRAASGGQAERPGRSPSWVPSWSSG
jgi:hypothetical protein